MTWSVTKTATKGCLFILSRLEDTVRKLAKVPYLTFDSFVSPSHQQQRMDFQKVSFRRLFGISLLLGYLGAQRLHETAHWAILQLFGRNPLWGFTKLVQIWDRQPRHPEEWIAYTTPDGQQGWLHLSSLPQSATEWGAMLAAGPLAQLAAVAAGFLLFRCNKKALMRELGLLWMLINSLTPAVYYLRGFLRGRTGGDETFLAFYLGMPEYVITIPLALAFAMGSVVGLYALQTWRTRMKWLAAFLLSNPPLGFSLMIADDVVLTQVDLRNPLFQPVLGFSLPVVVTDIIASLALVIMLTGHRFITSE